MKVDITKAQLMALMEATDTLSSMVGVGSEFDAITKKQVLLIDRFLKKNGYKRKYK